jgi:hypothetical protein
MYLLLCTAEYFIYTPAFSVWRNRLYSGRALKRPTRKSAPALKPIDQASFRGMLKEALTEENWTTPGR